MKSRRKSKRLRVPAVYLVRGYLPILAFLALRIFNNLRVLNEP